MLPFLVMHVATSIITRHTTPVSDPIYLPDDAEPADAKVVKNKEE
jgi:hypothetical protein